MDFRAEMESFGDANDEMGNLEQEQFRDAHDDGNRNQADGGMLNWSYPASEQCNPAFQPSFIKISAAYGRNLPSDATNTL